MKTHTNMLYQIYTAENVCPYKTRVSTCKICDTTFEKIRDLRYHIQTHLDRATLENLDLRSKPYLFDQIIPEAESDKTLCQMIIDDIESNIYNKFYQICEPQSGYEFELSDSESDDGENDFSLIHHICFECDQVFDRAYKLHQHIKQNHQVITELPYKCETCGRTYGTEFLLLRHLTRQCNNTSKPYECTRCHIKFQWETSLNRHNGNFHTSTINVNNRKHFTHKCETCEKSFPSRRTLLRHKKEHRPPEYKYRCPGCTGRFNNSLYLRKHLLKDHNYDTEETEKFLLAASLPELYKCNECTSLFRTTSEVVLHCIQKHQSDK